ALPEGVEDLGLILDIELAKVRRRQQPLHCRDQTGVRDRGVALAFAGETDPSPPDRRGPAELLDESLGTDFPVLAPFDQARHDFWVGLRLLSQQVQRQVRPYRLRRGVDDI